MSLIVYNASAGSGKTFTLALKYISMAVQSGKPSGYANILAVTFTNKATAEMKGRILSFLYSVAEREFSTDFFKKLREDVNEGLKAVGQKPISDETIAKRAKALLYAMMKDYDRFRVETIDSFFQSLLTNLAHELKLPRGFRVDLDDAATIAKAIDSMFIKINEEGNKPLLNQITSYIEHNIDDDQKWNIIKKLTAFAQKNLFSDGNAKFEKWVDSKFQSNNTENRRQRIEEFYKKIEDHYKKLKSIKDDIEGKILNDLNELSILLKQAKNSTLSSKKIGYVESFTKYCKTYIILPEEKLTKSVADISNDYEKLYDKKSSKDEQTQRIAQSISAIVRRLIDYMDDQKKKYFTASLILENLDDLCLLRAINEEVNRITHEEGTSLLSTTPKLFSDVVQEDDSSFVFERSGTTFHHVMIDEFQDTSRMQWNNFQKLLFETQADGNESMLVGDVKQSIYGWRGGDWKILGEDIGKNDRYNVESVPLNTNYRSLSNIVRFNNAFFVRAARLLDGEEVEDVTPFGTKEQDEDLKRIINASCKIDSDNNSDKPDSGKDKSNTKSDKSDLNYDKSKIYSYIYKDVVQTPNSDNKPEKGYVHIETYDTNESDDTVLEALYENIVKLHKEPYQIPYDKMMILVRGNKECTKILDYFNLHHANCECMPTSDEALLYTSSDLIMTLINALKCLFDPSDKIAYCMLERYVNESGLHEDKRASILTKFKGIIEDAEKRETWVQTPLYKLCRDLMEFFHFEGIDADQKQSSHKPNEVENGQQGKTAPDHKQSSYLFNFMDAVTQYLELNPSDLGAFIEYWDTTLSNKPISAELKGKPYITTIHKSKGLEGHTVFIPFAAFPLEKNLNSSFIWCDIKQKETKDTNESEKSKDQKESKEPEDLKDSALRKEFDNVPIIPIKTFASNKVKKSLFLRDYEEDHLQQSIENVNALYVAFTRAKCNLFIWAKSPTSKKGSETFETNSFRLIDSFVNGESGDITPTEKEWGEIAPYHNKEEEVKQNPFEEQDYPKLPVSMKPAHLQAVSFRQSNKAQEFIDISSGEITESEKKKNEYLTKGLLYHKLYSYIQKRDDIDAAIDRLINEDHVILPNKREEIRQYVEDSMEKNEKSDEWFSGNYRLYNEYNILTEEDGTIKEYRPDRVMEFDDKVVVVDYKFGKKEKKYEDQVQNYMSHLGTIFGNKDIEGYLWYINEDHDKDSVDEVPKP